MEHEKELLALLERIAVALEARPPRKYHVKETNQNLPEPHANVVGVLLKAMKHHEVVCLAEDGIWGMGDWNMTVGTITKMVNEDLGLNQHRFTSQQIGRVLRKVLKMQISERKRDGFHVWWNKGELEGKQP